jgi:predicted ATPase/signal transduction histidine kinase
MKTLQDWMLNDYCVTSQIYEGSRTLVYRGYRRNSVPKSVVLKLLRSEYPSFRELEQFRNQATIAQKLDIPGVIQTYGLESYQNRDILVMEDFDGISLKQAIAIWRDDVAISVGVAPGVWVPRFFTIALQVVIALDGLYRHQVIHKDIKPANILINLETHQVKVIDFSIASSLSQKIPTLGNTIGIEGTLAYVSPEQTGRTKRTIDYRTDFYALGVTFFELLTGELPFTSNDPMEMLHCHLAIQSPMAHEINPEVPPILSAIVSKLMAKNAEDRYQSAIGLQKDLTICWEQWLKTGEMISFELGQQDISDRFVLSQKLYGREQDVEALLTVFHRVANRDTALGHMGRSELVLVTGPSGIGKTAVIHQLHPWILGQQGYFIQGKFDQFQRNVPFSALVQALRDLMTQLLCQSNAQVERWKLMILRALGENAAVIVEVIPELVNLIGVQPPAIELSGSASQNRFNVLFQKFIQVFTTKDHPLVLFLDDLQWADLATLRLMQVLMDESSCHLLVIATYRDTEVSRAHPLIQTIDEIQKMGTVITPIALSPLTIEALNQLVADSLFLKANSTRSLSEFINTITQGNPFFSSQLLKSWHEDGFIIFDWNIQSWTFELLEIQAKTQTQDMVELISTKLQKLPLATQSALKFAACIGSSFELSMVSMISEQSPMDMALQLYPALQEGLVSLYAEQAESQDLSLPTQTYQFLHDRVQQAAYGLIPDHEKPTTYLKIGQLILSNTPEAAREEQIFAIVNPLNYGSALLINLADREELAQLNLIAGRKAMAATAYPSALSYLTQGIALLNEHPWQYQYSLTLALHELAIEASSLSASFELMEHLIESLLCNAECNLDRIGTYDIQIQSYSSQNRLLDAIQIAQKALNSLGFIVSMDPSQLDVPEAFQTTAHLLLDRSTVSLANLPTMTDPNQLAIMRIVMKVMPAVFLAIPPLYPILILSQVNASIQHGNSPFSPLCYACYGMLLNGILKKTKIANEFSELASQLASKLDSKDLMARTSFVIANFLTHSTVHVRDARSLLLDSYQTSIETGNIEYVGYCLQNLCNNSYLMGQELVSLEKEIRAYIKVLESSKQITNLNYCQIFRQAVLQFSTPIDRSGQLSGEACNEAELLPLLLEAHDLTGLHFFYFHKLILSYCFGDFANAYAYATEGRQYLAGGTGLITTPVYYFYASLAALAMYSMENSAEILQQVADNQIELKHWADHAPMNHLHKFYLVEAERYRILGIRAEAIEFYDQAIAFAKEYRYLNEEALAYELAGRFYLMWGKETIAQSYFTQAYYSYGRWGAIAKVQDLEDRYPQLLKLILNPHSDRTILNETISIGNSSYRTNTSRHQDISHQLDLKTVVKALQVLSSEIELEKLLTVLMQSMITHAGAENCILLLSDQENWLLSSQSTNTESIVLQSMPIQMDHLIPQSIIHYVTRTSETLVLDDASRETSFAYDPYIMAHRPKSLLCAPICQQGRLIGVLYLENNLMARAFTCDRLEILNLLTAQAAISLQNAQLYNTLEQKVQQRTQEIHDQNQYLSQTLLELQQTQSQLIQTEKMSSLGQMVAGVAHEINNPVNFIHGNLKYTSDYAKQLLDTIQIYQSCYPDPLPEVQEQLQSIDLDFLREDFPKTLSSMRMGTDRIRTIVLSLRNFSRLDEAEMKPVDIHEGLDSTLLILQHRLTAKNRPNIRVSKNYGQLPKVICFASQLNQVYMNLLSNAIDAMTLDKDTLSSDIIPEITIQTELTPESTIEIRISDNGNGIPESLYQKIFDPFFTTKPIGSGTGLGLFISYQIVVEKHQGKLTCRSSVNQGTEFTVEIPPHLIDRR